MLTLMLAQLASTLAPLAVCTRLPFRLKNDIFSRSVLPRQVSDGISKPAGSLRSQSPAVLNEHRTRPCQSPERRQIGPNPAPPFFFFHGWSLPELSGTRLKRLVCRAGVH